MEAPTSNIAVDDAPLGLEACDSVRYRITAMARPIRETDLYAPIKKFLKGQGYTIKGEVGAADVVACRANEDPLIVELKTGFSLSLFHQAIARQAITDTVYIGVPRGRGRAFQKALQNNLGLCRRLGIGLITIRLKDGLVEVHTDPGPYRPRKSAQKRSRLLKEFVKRAGDPNTGGATRKGLMTAYRQDALRCVNVLYQNGPTKAAKVASDCDVKTARRIMSDDHYGWFQRVQTGIYGLTPKGMQAVGDYEKELKRLAKSQRSRS